MAREVTWEEFDAASNALSDEELIELEAWLFPERAEQQEPLTLEDFDAALNALSDEELAELEAWLFPERAKNDETFERQRDGVYGWLHSYKKTIHIPELHKDLREFHNFIRPEVMEILENESRALGPFKFKLEIAVKIIKETNEGIEEIKYYTVQRNPILVNAFNQQIVTQLLNALAEAQEEALANHNQNGSGFIVDGMLAAYLKISRYNPLRRGSYMPLPKFIKTKGAVINVKNKDDQCLRWATKAATFPVEQNAERTSKYPKDADDGLDFRGILFLTPLNQISYVENLNKIGINVIGYNEGTQKFHPLHVTTMKEVPQVNVLFLQKGDKSHYCYVKSLSRLPLWPAPLSLLYKMLARLFSGACTPQA